MYYKEFTGTWYYNLSSFPFISVCLLKSDSCNTPSTMPIIVHHAQSDMKDYDDDAISDSLSNRCGWMLDDSTSGGTHVVTLYIFLQMNDDTSISGVGCKFLPWTFVLYRWYILVM